MSNSPRTIVIGAGVGGLTAAALLLKAGQQVTVLEAHNYPGGCAGTFFHQNYLFDAGATLAGGFSPGGPHARVGEMLGLEWPVRPVNPAWVVHLPNGRPITQWADRDQWEEERRRAFPDSEPFWRIQERLAGISWDISSRPFPWPPHSWSDMISLLVGLRPKTILSVPYLNHSVLDLPVGREPMFRTFLDSQLLISAQITAEKAGALYGSAALDLPRRGVSHVRGGMGSLAKTLVDWIRTNDGEILFRQRVERIESRSGRAVAVHTTKGLRREADFFLANVTPWGINQLLGADTPAPLSNEVARLKPTWGAFTLYLGLNQSALPTGIADHHQIIVDSTRPLGEGNSVFLSLADMDDPDRAPAGMRAATLSTHTDVAEWWRMRESQNDSGYFDRRDEFSDRLIRAAEMIIPGIRRAIHLILPGTPVTFQYYTGRPRGMVGGFAQSSIFSTRGPRTGIENLWQVGDSIFPGQSTAGVTMGAMRVAADVIAAERHMPRHFSSTTLPSRGIPSHAQSKQ